MPQFRENRASPNHSMTTIGAMLNIAPYAVPSIAEERQRMDGSVVRAATAWDMNMRREMGMSQVQRRMLCLCLP